MFVKFMSVLVALLSVAESGVGCSGHGRPCSEKFGYMMWGCCCGSNCWVVTLFHLNDCKGYCDSKDDSKRRRRLVADDGSVKVADEVCEHITDLVRENMVDEFVGLFTEHSGEAQAGAVLSLKERVVDLCSQKLTGFEAQQCKFYLEFLPLVDSQDVILKAALMDAFGGVDDRDAGCAAVVNAVNEKVDAIASEVNSPIKIGADGVVEWAADDDDVPMGGVPSGLASFVADGLSRRRLAAAGTSNAVGPVTAASDLSCTVVGGAAAAVVSGAAMVGVALGTMCKAFASEAAPRLIEFTPL